MVSDILDEMWVIDGAINATNRCVHRVGEVLKLVHLKASVAKVMAGGVEQLENVDKLAFVENLGALAFHNLHAQLKDLVNAVRCKRREADKYIPHINFTKASSRNRLISISMSEVVKF